VRLVYRGRDLSDTMSQYLVERLRRATNMNIETRSQVVELSGDDRLRTVKIRDGEGRMVERSVAARHHDRCRPVHGWSKTPCAWTTVVLS